MQRIVNRTQIYEESSYYNLNLYALEMVGMILKKVGIAVGNSVVCRIFT